VLEGKSIELILDRRCLSSLPCGEASFVGEEHNPPISGLADTGNRGMEVLARQRHVSMTSSLSRGRCEQRGW